MQVHDVVRRPFSAYGVHSDDVHANGRQPARDDVRLVASLLDGLGVPALVFGPCGEVLHETAAFGELAVREPDALLARHAPAEWLAAARGSGAGRRMAAGAATADDRALRLAGAATTVIARSVPLADVPSARGLAVVAVEVRPVGACLDDVLRDRFGMTRRERSVAIPFGEGAAPAAIAASLGMSRHTARHHLERIYAKLGVNSRASAVGRLRELDAALRATPAGPTGDAAAAPAPPS